MRDLRKDIELLFNDVSHNVILIRRDLRFRCNCYSERSGESGAGCPKCFGTGYVCTISRARTRRTLNSVPESLSNTLRAAGFGNVNAKQYVYYFEWDVNPSDGDLILEVNWNGRIPERILQKHVISVAEPLLGTGGRVEFWTVYVKYDPKGANDDAALAKY